MWIKYQKNCLYISELLSDSDLRHWKEYKREVLLVWGMRLLIDSNVFRNNKQITNLDQNQRELETLTRISEN